MEPEKREMREMTEADNAEDLFSVRIGDYFLKIEYSASGETLEERVKQYISGLARRRRRI